MTSASNRMFKLTTKICVLLILLAQGWLHAQDKQDYSSVPREKLQHSRAELEAEQQVSLSADKIIQLLRDEPGLLLQVKKALVRRAFEQGRMSIALGTTTTHCDCRSQWPGWPALRPTGFAWA